MSAYLLIKIDYSNGLGSPDVEEFPDYKSAMGRYGELRDEFLKETYIDEDEELDEDELSDELDEYRERCTYGDFDIPGDLDDFIFMESSDHGDGLALGIMSEEDMLANIMEKVNKSEDVTEFHRIGEFEEYRIQVPCVYIESPFQSLFDDDTYCTIQTIYRRPYDPDDKDDTEYIYDVCMRVYYNDEPEGIEYTDSVECVSYDVLVGIWYLVNNIG